MKRLSFCCLFFSFCFFARGQEFNSTILDSLDKIVSQHDQSQYFASVYRNAIRKTNAQARRQPGNVQKFIFDFETGFSDCFFEAHSNYQQAVTEASNWKNYFERKSLNELQLMIMGVNAHINGDFWKALVKMHPYDSIRKYRHALVSFQRSMNFMVDSLYKEKKQYKNVNLFHTVTLGLDKVVAKRMILGWRKKQVRLALLYYKNRHRLHQKLDKLDKKMHRFDRFVVRWLR